MHQADIRVIWAGLGKFFWALFLVTLPITSFPYFPKSFGGDALVRPLSMFPLIALLVLATLPRLIVKPIPKTILLLLPFTLIALASSLYALLQGVDSLLGVSVAQRTLRALITFGIGAAIYVTVSLWPNSPEDLRATLRWIYLGFGLALTWGSVQAIYVLRWSPAYFTWVNNIQRYLSTRTLFINRVSGLTYEPNWFAEQISLLLMPWLLASVIRSYSVFPWRNRWLSIELLLLGWATAILALTFSRAGLILLVALVIISVMFFRPNTGSSSLERRPYARWTRRVVETSFALLILAGFIYLAGANNTFFSRIWDYWASGRRLDLANYVEYLGFGSRLTYGLTAFKVYELEPLFGVGLGNFAFYFEGMLPDRILAETPEVLHILTQNATRYRLITPKNLYLRVLAETGLLGLSAFLAFIIAILGCALSLWLSPKPEAKYWGTGGLYALIAFAFLANSFDSFAIPNMWVAFGIITAATRVSYTSSKDEIPISTMQLNPDNENP